MQTRQVTGSTYPEKVELLQEKKLININVVEKTNEDATSYEYTQIVTSPDSDTDDTIAEYEYYWAVGELKSSDIEIKYHLGNSSRAKLTLEGWCHYQESLRDYATYDGSVYKVMTEKPVRPA